MTEGKKEIVSKGLSAVTIAVNTVLSILMTIFLSDLQELKNDQKLVLQKLAASEQWQRDTTPRIEQALKDIREHSVAIEVIKSKMQKNSY